MASNSSLQFVPGQRAGKLVPDGQLVLDGYIMHFQYPYTNKDGVLSHHWICSAYKSDLKCKFRAKTTGNQLAKTSNRHICGPAPEKVMAKEVIGKIKTAARTTIAAPSSIVAEAMAGVPQSVKAVLPVKEYLTSTINHARKTANQRPPNPTNAVDLQIISPYSEYKGQNFILYDNKASPRIIVFGTESNLDRLNTTPHWGADGTFKVPSKQFEQLWTIHGFCASGLVTPLIFALLENKEEATYREVLKALKDLKPTLKPASVMVDFEMAEQKAFAAEFPPENGTKIRGCLFHFSQAIYRRIKKYPDVLKVSLFNIYFYLILIITYFRCTKILRIQTTLFTCEHWRRWH